MSPLPLHDAMIEIAEAYARVRTLTPDARHWVEAHVTLAQVRLWCDGVLEVPPHVISDLLLAMLTTGLKLIPETHLRVIHRKQIAARQCLLRVSPH
jgi:hypothetical protein